MADFQHWLEQTLRSADTVATLMQTQWAWPIAESVHFIGLTLLFGSIAAWDLRLLGIAKSVPIAAFHRLVPLSVVGFTLNASTGSMFLMTYPDQVHLQPGVPLQSAVSRPRRRERAGVLRDHLPVGEHANPGCVHTPHRPGRRRDVADLLDGGHHLRPLTHVLPAE